MDKVGVFIHSVFQFQQRIDLTCSQEIFRETGKGGIQPPKYPPPTYRQKVNKSLDFIQLDGNVSLESIKIENENIPIYISNRTKKQVCERPPPSWKTLRRDNKSIQALALPIISNYNMRSIFGKINNFSEDMKERQTDLCFLTEIWEKKENKKTPIQN